MTQKLQTFIAIVQDQSVVPITHFWWLTTTCNYTPKGSYVIFSPCGPGIYVIFSYTDMSTHMDKIKYLF